MRARNEDYEISLETISKISEGTKPKLLLHACCGPCSCFPLTFLCQHFNVTIYYGNSNIYPFEEYDRRKKELEVLLQDLKKDEGLEVGLVMPPYDHEEYMKDLRPFALQKEGRTRCFLCYRKRMEEAYDYAESHGFDYFTTVMTISRQKSSHVLNAIGLGLEKQHKHCRYFISDFKKNGGIEKGRQIRLKYGLYNQLYCGCEYSFQAMKKRSNNSK